MTETEIQKEEEEKMIIFNQSHHLPLLYIITGSGNTVLLGIELELVAGCGVGCGEVVVDVK